MAELSRQRLNQLYNRAKGLCMFCNTQATKSGFCDKHYEAHKKYCRKRNRREGSAGRMIGGISIDDQPAYDNLRAKIAREYSEVTSASDLATRYGCSQSCIYKILADHGIQKMKRGRHRKVTQNVNSKENSCPSVPEQPAGAPVVEKEHQAETQQGAAGDKVAEEGKPVIQGEPAVEARVADEANGNVSDVKTNGTQGIGSASGDSVSHN